MQENKLVTIAIRQRLPKRRKKIPLKKSHLSLNTMNVNPSKVTEFEYHECELLMV